MQSINFKASVCLLSLWTSGCFFGSGDSKPSIVPEIHGPQIEADSIARGEGQRVSLSNGAEIFVENRAGVLFFKVQGTLSEESFARLRSSVALKPQKEQLEIFSSELGSIHRQVRNLKAVAWKEYPEVGYFEFELPYQEDLMAPLHALSFPHSVVFNPIVHDPDLMRDLKEVNPSFESQGSLSFAKTHGSSAHPKEDRSDFSGLRQMRVPEFLKLAQAELGGHPVNGSSVRVGVADTGVTLNHPTFFNESQSRSRIEYMRDFTAEGRVYFNPSARFQATPLSPETPEELLVQAEVILTPKLPHRPLGDQLAQVRDLRLRVSPELRSLLLQPGSGAKLGILSEENFQGSEPVDINGDGKTNTHFYLIFVPGKTPAQDVVYVDPSGTGDFRNAKPLGDWNITHASVAAFAEKFGFDFKDEVLPSVKPEQSISVRSVSLVGFDPGNHGTHVSGIIAGRKTITNDRSNTLARGVVPEATLAVNRACANSSGCSFVEAAIDLVTQAHVDVVNLSLGRLTQYNDGFSVQDLVINRLTQVYNVLFVISAGNSGPGRQTIGSPSAAKYSLSVGATASASMIRRQYQWPAGGSELQDDVSKSDDFLLFFSSRGPTAAGGFKPNLVAPGTELSAVQLNVPPGHHAGLEVYWGTSMAAPSATGAFALLLDAIKKYNHRYPETPLTTDAIALRQVLMESARPFRVSRFDVEKGEYQKGPYTWADEGMGMLDLPQAWSKLFELREAQLESAVSLEGKPVELEYQVLVPIKNPSGVAYDGSRQEATGGPSFGEGLYLNASEVRPLYPIGVSRRLPEKWASHPQVGDLTMQLRTTQDEFLLKTYIYGSDQPWVRAGTLDDLDCSSPEDSEFALIGEGATVETLDHHSGRLNLSKFSTLNLCMDEAKIATLQPGDHGALIQAYRIVDGKVAVLPSFTVPIFMTVPHQELSSSEPVVISRSIKSFEGQRNYLKVPEGTSFVQVTLEVPPVVLDDQGNKTAQSHCSSVELMALIGKNTSKLFASRSQARVSNCDSSGRPIDSLSQRRVRQIIPGPMSGIWDLHVFGSYPVPNSDYTLTVDYFKSSSSIQEIRGDFLSLSGRFRVQFNEASLPVGPDPRVSRYELQGLKTSHEEVISGAGEVMVKQDGRVFHEYLEGVNLVRATISGSSEADLDLLVIGCDKKAQDLSDPSCHPVMSGTGPTDREEVIFKPSSQLHYAFKVLSSESPSLLRFQFSQFMSFEPELGMLQFMEDQTEAGNRGFEVSYEMSPDQVSRSVLLQTPCFQEGRCSITGLISVLTSGGVPLAKIPLEIQSASQKLRTSTP
ncbi:MAG: S8 family serine peptidase [Bdellovibrionia bacterium]